VKGSRRLQKREVGGEGTHCIRLRLKSPFAYHPQHHAQGQRHFFCDPVYCHFGVTCQL
jgi:hypothetical protein